MQNGKVVAYVSHRLKDYKHTYIANDLELIVVVTIQIHR